MCLLFLIFGEAKGAQLAKAFPTRPILLFSVRDECFHRPTQRGSVCSVRCGTGSVYAPIDLEAGGTWLSYNNSNHRFAVILNYHETLDDTNSSEDFISRGLIPGKFTESSITTDDFLSDIQKTFHRLKGFSLIFGDHKSCHYVSNKCPDSPVQLAPHQLHGFSNGSLNADPSLWPRIGVGKSIITQHLDEMRPTSVNETRRKLKRMVEDFRSSDYVASDPALRSTVHERLILPPTWSEELNLMYGTRTLTVIATFEDTDGQDKKRADGVGENSTGGDEGDGGVFILESDCNALTNPHAWVEKEHILLT